MEKSSGAQIGSVTTDKDGKIRLNTRTMGTDVGQIVNAMSAGFAIPVKKIEDQISKINTELDAIREFSTKLKAMNDILKPLSNRLSLTEDNIFKEKTVITNSDDISIDANRIVNITATKSASLLDFTIKVTRLATKDSITASAGATDSSTALGADGTFDLNGQTITITSDMTLSDVANAINNVKATTKITAAVKKISDTDSRLALNHENTGTPISFDNETGSVLTELNLAESGATTSSLSAEIVVDGDTGTPITRSSNHITDLYPGITIDLLAVSSATVTAKIDYDRNRIMTSIADFVDNYNALIDYKNKQTATGDDGKAEEGAVLAKNYDFKSIMMQLHALVNGLAAGVSSSQPNSLSRIGITLDSDERTKLEIDATTLANKINDDAENMLQLFGFSYTSSLSTFYVTTHPDAVSGTIAGEDFTVQIDRDASGDYSGSITLDATTVTLSASNIKASGTGLTITAPSDSIFKGFTFAYLGGEIANEGSKSATINATQGIANQVSRYLQNTIIDESKPQNKLSAVEDALKSKEKRLDDELERKKATKERKEVAVIKKMSGFQSASQKLQSMSAHLDSFLNPPK